MESEIERGTPRFIVGGVYLGFLHLYRIKRCPYGGNGQFRCDASFNESNRACVVLSLPPPFYLLPWLALVLEPQALQLSLRSLLRLFGSSFDQRKALP